MAAFLMITIRQQRATVCLTSSIAVTSASASGVHLPALPCSLVQRVLTHSSSVTRHLLLGLVQAHTWAGKENPTFETLAGTPGYMCPEILEGFVTRDKSVPRPYDGVKADVYSAGVMLVVMLLHTMPWHYDTYAAR